MSRTGRKVAIITSGSQGIGASLVAAYRRNGSPASGRSPLASHRRASSDTPDSRCCRRSADRTGRVVHLRILPGLLEDYQAVIQRAVVPA
jgi:NAD(P)-dependent dehydrogenase (short-subunit alcohol dehydrogenase family)